MFKNAPKRMAHALRLNRKYVLVSVIIFLWGGMLGYLNAEALGEFIAPYVEQLMDKVEDIQAHGGSTLYTFWVLFKNNVSAALMMLVLGVFFGVFPAFALLVNGMMIGFMLKMVSMQGLNPWEMFVYGILPHGVLELSAIFIATAIGFKYGVLSFRFIGSLFNRDKRVKNRRDWSEHLSYLPLMVLLIIGMLFVAAIVESAVTPLVIETMIGEKLNLMKP